jgi:hypothetical protein
MSKRKQTRKPLPEVSNRVMVRAFDDAERHMRESDPMVAKYYDSLWGVDDCGCVLAELGDAMFRLGVQHGRTSTKGGA